MSIVEFEDIQEEDMTEKDKQVILPPVIVPKNADSLAEYFADIILSGHNQHCIVRIVGIAGTGKSWGAVDLGVEVSKIVAEKKGGLPTDYYNFDKNIAVMDREDITRIMDNPGKYHIIHLDDLGVPMNARKYRDKFNIDFNDIIQTFRPNNNLVIMTMQSGFLVDKVPRALAHYEIEMESANFDEGYTIAKVNRIVLKHKSGKIFYPYIFLNGTKYVRHVFEMQPIKLMNEYERIRAIKLQKMKENNAKREQELMENSQKPYKKTLAETKFELKRDIEAGIYEGLNLKQVCKAKGINYRSLMSS